MLAAYDRYRLAVANDEGATARFNEKRASTLPPLGQGSVLRARGREQRNETMILATIDKIPRPVAQMRGSRRTCVLQLAATIAAYLSGYAVSSAQVLADCTSPPQQGNDGYAGYRGMFLASAPLPSGKFSRFHVVTDANPSSACFNFTSEGTGLVGALYPPNVDRQFNQGNTGRIFVYGGSAGPGHPACGHTLRTPHPFEPVAPVTDGPSVWIPVEPGTTT